MTEKKVSIFKRFLPIILTVIVIIVDQITKILVVSYNTANNGALSRGIDSNFIKLIGEWLRVKLVFNDNMIFGLDFGLPDEYKHFILIALTLIAIVVIIIFFTKIKTEKLYPRICFGLIIGGAFGNIIDRIFGHILYYGEFKLFFEKGVVDWIDMGIPKGLFGLENGWRFFTYNIADSCVTISIILLLIYLIFAKEEEMFKINFGKKARKENPDKIKDPSESDGS